MATTNYPLNHPQAVKHWSGDVFKQALKQTYAMRFMGTNSNSLCQVRNEMKEEGDRVRVGLRMQLTGSGVSGDGTLEGNEEALSIYHDDVYIDQLRHAVRSGGKMSEQRIPFSVRQEARDGLADWFADHFDYAFFNQLTGNTGETDTKLTGNQSPTAPSSSNIVMDATSTASLATSDTMSPSIIEYAVEKAEDGATYPLRPLKLQGQDYYVMFMHTYQKTDLRTGFSAGEWGDIQKAAIQGGQTTGNPIFSGALGVWGGVVLHSSSRIPETASNVRRAVLCGAQAAAIAFGKGNSMGNKFTWVEELFDYENQLGVAAGTIYGLKKMVFNSEDHATITVVTYAASHA